MMAYSDTIAPPRIRAPKIGFQIKITREKGTGGGEPDPEDKRGFFRRAWDALRNLIKVRVR